MTRNRGFKKRCASAFLLIGGLTLHCSVLADVLPVFTTQPTNKVVSSGFVSLVANAQGASTYQWRFNGADIPGATNSTLQVTNVQTTNSGYYTVISKNEAGWVPSSMAFLAVVPGPGGTVRLGNNGVPSARAYSQSTGQPISSGSAQLYAGPALDQMQPVGDPVAVVNGYFSGSTLSVPTVAPNQTVYYRVDIGTQQSSVLTLVAGGYSPAASVTNLVFPYYIEWPEHKIYPNQPLQLTCIPGETIHFTNSYGAYLDYGIPTLQWRKDGAVITGPVTNHFSYMYDHPYFVSFDPVLTITNVQPKDAGIYDAMILGPDSFIGPKFTLSVQTTNGRGVITQPRLIGTNFVCGITGIAGRSYAIQWSTNLTDWNYSMTVNGTSGCVIVTNSFPSLDRFFYRTQLLPF